MNNGNASSVKRLTSRSGSRPPIPSSVSARTGLIWPPKRHFLTALSQIRCDSRSETHNRIVCIPPDGIWGPLSDPTRKTAVAWPRANSAQSVCWEFLCRNRGLTPPSSRRHHDCSLRYSSHIRCMRLPSAGRAVWTSSFLPSGRPRCDGSTKIETTCGEGSRSSPPLLLPPPDLARPPSAICHPRNPGFQLAPQAHRRLARRRVVSLMVIPPFLAAAKSGAKRPMPIVALG